MEASIVASAMLADVIAAIARIDPVLGVSTDETLCQTAAECAA
jgi:hypothetical protein